MKDSMFVHYICVVMFHKKQLKKLPKNNINLIFFWIFRTTVSVIVISTLLLYRALVAQVENDPKESDHLKLQRLEKRVRELESLLGNFN